MFVSVTDAFGTTAPVASLTVPWMVPDPATCDWICVAHRKIIRQKNAATN